MNNGSSKFYRELGYEVIEISSRKDIILKLALKKFDSVVSPCPSWKRECIASMVTTSKNKTVTIHNNIKYRSLLPSGHAASADPKIHDIENTLTSLKDYDLSLEDFLTAKESLKTRFYDQNLQNEKYVVLHPTASTKYKYYPQKFWIELAASFSNQGYNVYVLSGSQKTEIDFCLDIVKEIPQVIYLKSANFLKLCSIIRNANYFVGLDSSILHLAATFDCDLVGLWSFADYRRIFPFGSKAKIYLPEEVMKATSFKYPKNELQWMNRARAQDIMKIFKNEISSTFEIASLSISPVWCYKY